MMRQVFYNGTAHFYFSLIIEGATEKVFANKVTILKYQAMAVA
jgi:hypothetical protein